MLACQAISASVGRVHPPSMAPGLAWGHRPQGGPVCARGLSRPLLLFPCLNPRPLSFISSPRSCTQAFRTSAVHRLSTFKSKARSIQLSRAISLNHPFSCCSKVYFSSPCHAKALVWDLVLVFEIASRKRGLGFVFPEFLSPSPFLM